MYNDIRSELRRVHAEEIIVRVDELFEPKAGALMEVELNDAYWHLLPEHFLELLRDLPDGAGTSGVHQAIEERGSAVWHGPSPKGARDNSL
jgi:hypothetical protein